MSTLSENRVVVGAQRAGSLREIIGYAHEPFFCLLETNDLKTNDS
jgi:hypothetical protein